MSDVEKALAQADAAMDKSVERLLEFLRIPSISADPAYAEECDKAARWLSREINALGMTAEVRPTGGRPMVVAHGGKDGGQKGSPSRHALFYGHYDVQPADPLDLWCSSPFEPQVIKDEKGVTRIYARGAADDKGQLLTFVEAARAWIAATGQLPFRATFLIEGEEESGSASLLPFMKDNRDELSCDIAFICDTNMWDNRTPAITTRLRGLAADEITIRGPRIDLHSGAYGGAAANPIRVLTKVIASLHDARGRVAIPGFYEGVKPLPLAVKKQWASLKFSEKQFMKEIGLSKPAGEAGYSVLEQLWARPTAEVNGIWGGYTGAGSKTVIPAEAHAKFTFRLVGKQNPDKIIKSFRRFVKTMIPKDCKVSFSDKAHGAAASEVAEDNPYIRLTSRALEAEFGRPAMLIGTGGSIPIVRYFKDVLGLDSVLAGFGLNDDAIHSPNEKYDLSSFTRGVRSWVRVMGELGG